MPHRTKAALAVLLAALLVAPAAMAADPGIARMPLRDFASHAEALLGLSPRIDPDRLPNMLITLISDREFSRPEWRALHDTVLGLLARHETQSATDAPALQLLAVRLPSTASLADALAAVRPALSEQAETAAAPRAGCLVLRDDATRLEDALGRLAPFQPTTHK